MDDAACYEHNRWVAHRRESALNAGRLAHGTDGEKSNDAEELQGIGDVVCADIGVGVYGLSHLRVFEFFSSLW